MIVPILFTGIPAIACINKIDLPSVTKDANKYKHFYREPVNEPKRTS